MAKLGSTTRPAGGGDKVEAKSPAGGKGKAPTTKRSRRAVKRVLFLGNSYTYANNLPAMIQKLAVAAREPEGFNFYAVTPGGCTLSRHWGKTGARLQIRKGHWDHVVLQEQSQMPILRREETHKYAAMLDGEIKAVEAKTVLYMTWARKHLPHQQHDLTEAYLGIAKDLRAQVAPVGLAWQMALREKPTMPLHRSDKSHPTQLGTYLAACVFYATFYGKNPAGLPGRLTTVTKDGRPKVLANISSDDAVYCQDIAWKAVQKIKKTEKTEKTEKRP